MNFWLKALLADALLADPRVGQLFLGGTTL